MAFTPRLKKPEAGNKYYITIAKGGYSGAIVGSPTDKDCNVLANCVGYAAGRFNEIIGQGKFVYLQYPPNAENFYAAAQAQGLKTGSTPELGAIIVWQKGATLNSSDGAGHVAVVEQMNADGTTIVTSESGYGSSNPFWTTKRVKGADGNWGGGTGYKFLGFIYQPTKITAPATPTPTEPAKVNRTIKKGMKGDDVREMQQALVKLGYLRAGEVDGDFGKVTLGALLAFQLENDLDIDGLCGPATKKALGI